MVGLLCVVEQTFNSKKRFCGRISRMYFLRRTELRGASTGLLQQSVRIVATRDLTLVVRPKRPETHEGLHSCAFDSLNLEP